MYILHIANKNYSSWSLRPWILLRQLDIAFDEEMHPFQADIQAQREQFLAFSPSAKVLCCRMGKQLSGIAWPLPSIWPRRMQVCGPMIVQPVPGRARRPARCIPDLPICVNAAP